MPPFWMRCVCLSGREPAKAGAGARRLLRCGVDLPVAKSIVAWADWGMDLQTALAMPHAVNRFGAYDLEAGTSAEALSEPLSAMGFEVNPRGLNSGLHAIEIGDTLKGAADPRREGIALGG